MPASPWPDERAARRWRGRRAATGSVATAVVVGAVVVALVAVVAVAAGGKVVPFGVDDDGPVGEAGGDPAGDGALALGELTVTSEPARNGPAGDGMPCPPGDQCLEFEVTCPGVPDPGRGAMAIGALAGPPRGVVVLFSGGKGSNWWQDGPRAGSAEAAPFVAQLQQAGYEVVQVRWDDGFSTNPSGEPIGFARAACRSATAVRWVHDNRYEQLGVDPDAGVCGFCISGNSGGSSQSAWTLTHYGLDDIVDAAILTSGPPHAAIATGCLQQGDRSYWYDRSSARGFDEVYGGRAGRGPCTAQDASLEDLMEADSIDVGGAFYDYPETRVVFVWGDNDQTVAVTHARDYLARLEEEGSPLVDVVEVQTMGHEITQSGAGLEAMYEAITATTS